MALKALQAAKMSPLVHQCQKALNDISTQHTMELYWVPRHAGVWGNEISDKLTRDGSVQKYIGPELSLGVSRQNIRNNIKCWVDNQHLAIWWGHCGNQRQTRKLVSGPGPATKAWLLFFNRTQSRVVTGLLTGHNTLRRHLYVMVLSNDPTCRKCGMEEESSVHVLCECEALASLRLAHLGSFFLDPKDIMNISRGIIWNFGKGTWLL
jgi:predicted Zn-ribbon and HTH transcriptional regulator